MRATGRSFPPCRARPAAAAGPRHPHPAPFGTRATSTDDAGDGPVFPASAAPDGGSGAAGGDGLDPSSRARTFGTPRPAGAGSRPTSADDAGDGPVVPAYFPDGTPHGPPPGVAAAAGRRARAGTRPTSADDAGARRPHPAPLGGSADGGAPRLCVDARPLCVGARGGHRGAPAPGGRGVAGHGGGRLGRLVGGARRARRAADIRHERRGRQGPDGRPRGAGRLDSRAVGGRPGVDAAVVCAVGRRGGPRARAWIGSLAAARGCGAAAAAAAPAGARGCRVAVRRRGRRGRRAGGARLPQGHARGTRAGRHCRCRHPRGYRGWGRAPQSPRRPRHRRHTRCRRRRADGRRRAAGGLPPRRRPRG
ncbi:hypothetical protein BU14_2900s0001, partial [Porphyra umbilicalis]